MPELPEVETVRRTLAKHIVGRTICGVEIHLPKIVAAPFDGDFVQTVVGRRIIGLRRRGKYLLATLSGDRTLVVHLRMTGQWVACTLESPVIPHTHVVFCLDDGKQVRFADLRQFGRLVVIPSDLVPTFGGLASLGPEPLAADFTEQDFAGCLQGKKTKLKPLLLDQKFLAGLGNIYANEALARAGLHPDRPANELTASEKTALYQGIRTVLLDGIAAGGTSLRDYVDGEGRQGKFQAKLQVHGREGKPCQACGTPIVRVKRGGRSTYFCPRCQTIPGDNDIKG
ncbi:MAG: bifunctional DNA-formamidopyrimidine glycosylase/DNA-(apurinic or apyrimidinic site) lyase [Heliobacteriaceae bacterium]|nr:bifunctional DNA-formamidopyrimidine glycosylase/DNA-(apurinic or apyrimidinic site) lyase [Heliobacteriaceae bacterium]MDD4587817.1 bifunctional DNA-formamidopyrimidine glycosylase/DNA-(apurinic or apyrimidinic site) lyase [Heliobacteriaceae bacterium]